MILSTFIQFVNGFSSGLSLVTGNLPVYRTVGRLSEMAGYFVRVASSPSRSFTLGNFVGQVIASKAPSMPASEADIKAVERVVATREDWDVQHALNQATRRTAPTGVKAIAPVTWQFSGEGCYLTPVEETLTDLPLVEGKLTWEFTGEEALLGKAELTPAQVEWLATKGYQPVAGGGKVEAARRTLVVGNRHPRIFGAVVESRQVLIVASPVKPNHPATPLLVYGQDQGESSPIPGVWKEMGHGFWKFEEAQYVSHISAKVEKVVGWDADGKRTRTVEVGPGFFKVEEVQGCPVTQLETVQVPVTQLGKVTMPFGTMRIFPRSARLADGLARKLAYINGRPHKAKIRFDVTSEADELGYEGRSLAQMFETGGYRPSKKEVEKGCPDRWQKAQSLLAKQWLDKGEDAEGILVPVTGIPLAALKPSYLESQVPNTHGVLRQQIRQYLDASRQTDTLEEMLLSPHDEIEVREFTATPSGYWDAQDNYINTGCSEGHMLSIGWRREFTQVLECQGVDGQRLTPKKARALAEAASRLQEKAANFLLSNVARSLPAGHEDYCDDRPIDGGVQLRDGMQMNRLAASYQKAVEQEVMAQETADREEGYGVDDDYESDPELKDNCIAWQDEYEDLTSPEKKFSGRIYLDPREKHGQWFGTFKAMDRFDRIATLAKTPGEDADGLAYGQAASQEYRTTCEGIRESRQYLAAAETTPAGEGTLKDLLNKARQEASDAVKAVASGAEEEAQRVAFIMAGLVADPELASWVAVTDPNLILSLKDSDPELFSRFPARVQAVKGRKTPVKEARKAAAVTGVLSYLGKTSCFEQMVTNAILDAKVEAEILDREAQKVAAAKKRETTLAKIKADAEAAGGVYRHEIQRAAMMRQARK